MTDENASIQHLRTDRPTPAYDYHLGGEGLGGLSPDEHERVWHLKQRDQPDLATIQPDPAGIR